MLNSIVFRTTIRIWNWLFGRLKKDSDSSERGRGAIPSPKDERDFSPPNELFVGFIDNPDEYVQWVGPVQHQGDKQSCSAFAFTDCCEFLQYVNDGTEIELSPRYNWYHTRLDENVYPFNTGVYLRDVLKVGQKIGNTTENLCKYDDPDLPPTKWAESFAKYFRIGEYSRIYTLSQLKTALCNDWAVMIGMNVWEGFSEQQTLTTILPKRPFFIGGHAMRVIGHDAEGILVKNSWGSYWGRGGLCCIPYDVFLDSKGYIKESLIFECWAITNLKRRDGK